MGYDCNAVLSHGIEVKTEKHQEERKYESTMLATVCLHKLVVQYHSPDRRVKESRQRNERREIYESKDPD